jgi:putative ABC transport system ATP-binding protein
MILAARALSKIYRAGTAERVSALREVSLDVPAGSFTLLKGPSGSGKTTLLALLGALDRPTGGQVLIDGRDVGECSDAERARLRRRMGFVFQDYALLPGLPAWENATYHLIPRGLGRGERRRLAVEQLIALGLGERLEARPAELSGGEQQRLAFARALIGTPEGIFADEPTSNLDDAAAEAVIARLRAAHTAGASVVAASHDSRLVTLATSTVALSGGTIAGNA